MTRSDVNQGAEGKVSGEQALREAEIDLRRLDALNLPAGERLERLFTCIPSGRCSTEYVDAYHARIQVAKADLERAVEKGAQLARMADQAREKAARLLAYAEDRQGQASRALLIKVSDQRFKPYGVL